MKKFTSQIIRGGYWLTPYVLEIDDVHVRFSKRTKWLVNKEEASIRLDKVSCVNIKPSIIGTDITIESYGEGIIKAKNFSLIDAKEIKHIIEQFKEQHEKE
jgi:hypothetical protein